MFCAAIVIVLALSQPNRRRLVQLGLSAGDASVLRWLSHSRKMERSGGGDNADCASAVAAEQMAAGAARPDSATLHLGASHSRAAGAVLEPFPPLFAPLSLCLARGSSTEARQARRTGHASVAPLLRLSDVARPCWRHPYLSPAWLLSFRAFDCLATSCRR